MHRAEIAKPLTRSSPRGNTGHSALFSAVQNAANNTGAMMSNAKTSGDVHPSDRPKRKPMTNASRAPTRLNAPAKSKEDSEPCRSSPFMNFKAMIKARTANGILPRKTDSQSNQRTSKPAPKVPANMPSAWLPAVNPIPSPRMLAGKTLAAMAGETA